MAHDRDSSEELLPASPDINWGVRLLIIAGILTSIMQGSFVVGSSGMMHVWPSIQSTKVDLPPFKP
ncbi:MAG: hypothetical protein JOY59_13975 [Candidatus Eremiobacteraeota bacterium]|nr:hypothetical protein [Candidatus Eremiobacteraeota bacterium]